MILYEASLIYSALIGGEALWASQRQWASGPPPPQPPTQVQMQAPLLLTPTLQCNDTLHCNSTWAPCWGSSGLGQKNYVDQGCWCSYRALLLNMKDVIVCVCSHEAVGLILYRWGIKPHEILDKVKLSRPSLCFIFLISDCCCFIFVVYPKFLLQRRWREAAAAAAAVADASNIRILQGSP